MRNGIDTSHVQTVTPTSGSEWLEMEPELRMDVCQKLLNQHNCEIDIVTTNARGEVIVQMRKNLNSADRGTALLDAESILKSYDPAITIYLEAKDDKNPLRKFRGVVINDDRR